MNKKYLVIIVGLIILIAFVSAIFFVIKWAGQKGATAPGEPRSESVRVGIREEGSIYVEYPKEGVSLILPPGWNPQPYPDLRDGLRTSYKYNGSTLVNLSLFLKEDEIKINVEDFRETNPDYSVESINNNGIIYRGALPNSEFDDYDDPNTTTKYIPDETKESYLIGKGVELNEGVVYLECLTKGPQYTELISTCDNIVESLSIK